MAGRLKDTGSKRGHAGPSATTADISSKQFCTKIIVSNIPPAVKREELVSFLQSSNVSCAVDDFQELISRNGAAVLTLAAPVDVVKLREICESTPLQGQVLQIEAAEGLEDADSSGARATSGAQSVPVTTRATSSHVCLEALVSDIPSTVTDDYLTNLLECATDDCDVKNVRRGTKEGVAVVVFDKPVDTDEIQSFCNENAEDGNVLRVEPVPNAGAVLIRNPPPEISTGSFKFYLSNTKRSGGSKGVTIDRDAHNLYLVAKFDSRDVAERVAERHHSLEGHDLQLEMFDLDLNILPRVVTRVMGKPHSLRSHKLQLELDRVDPYLDDFSTFYAGRAKATSSSNPSSSISKRSRGLRKYVADIQDICEKNPLMGKVLRAEAFHTETDHNSTRCCMEAVFSGITLSDDRLTNFLECKCQDCAVEKILRGNKKDTAKAVFEDPVDFMELEKTCKNNLFDGQELKVLPADERGAVLVLNPHPNIKNNAFDFFFENTRRSGGGKVLRLDRDETHNKYLIVYFETKEVAERVAKRQHTLQGQELQLKLFDLDLDDPPNSGD